jgi:trimeric autotransporter adhesin
MKTNSTFIITLVLLFVTTVTANAQSWSIHGNTGIDPKTNFIGTLNNKGLPFRTNNIERMRITYKGNVGIGVKAAQQKLDVNGNINIAGDSGLYFGNWKILSVPVEPGDLNVALGQGSMINMTSGIGNTTCGAATMGAFKNGQENTAIGSDALNQIKSGGQNTAVGGSTLIISETGSGNTALGYFAITNDTSFNSMALGYHSGTFADNQVRVGDFNITSIGGVVDWSVTSDARVKKNIKANVPGLAFINKLNPVTYNLDLDAADKFMNRSVIKALDGKTIQPSAEDIAAKKLQEQITYTGFVAQDVEKVAKSLNYDFSGVDAAKNSKDLYGLRYAEFVVPLVKAVQELSKMNNEKDVAIQQQNVKIDNLQKQIDDLKTMIASSTNNQNAISVSSSASLLQNTPNPFSNSTIINYVLPTNYSSAYIIITDKNGNTLKQIKLTSKGKGSLTVDHTILSSGAYSYTLYVNNKLVGSKQMDYLK